MSRATVLVTGGSGFLGRHLAVALRSEFDVILGGRNNKQNRMAAERTGCTITPLDVTNIESVRDALRQYRPDFVIHAAATKFVDLAESQPLECIDVNVLGSENVARACMDAGVEGVIGISTDKAAPPVRNTYGLSKALMERAFCALDKVSTTRFLCVRYGNVAWSTGSVLPTWKRMHDQTRIIGTTGPEMRRFFFSVDEAVSLVRTALCRSTEFAGRVLTREMKSALIRDLLDVWIERFGGSWQVIAARPGERDDEYLVGDLELPYTERLNIEGVTHFAISFNERAKAPLAEHVSSANAERLTHSEMVRLIESCPEEDL